MSVFTHLKPSEIKCCLNEAARAVNPGGAVICSYLDRATQRRQFRSALMQKLARMRGRDVMASFTTADELAEWLEQSGFTVEKVLSDWAGG